MPAGKIRAADIPDLAGADQIVQRAQHLVGGRFRIEPVQLIEVDVIRSEPAQAGLDGWNQVLTRGAHVIGPGPGPEGGFGGDENLVAATLDELVRSGKVRYIGCSNFSGWHLMKSLAVSERYGHPRYVAHQAYYSLIGRDYEWELMPLALDQGVGTVVWSPLGWGRLTGKIRRGQPPPETSRLQSRRQQDAAPPVSDEYLFGVIDALDEISRETGKSVPQVALNWLLQRPTVASVIIGARNEEQLRQNLGAVGWSLTPEQVTRLDAASAGTPPYPYWHQRNFVDRNPPPV